MLTRRYQLNKDSLFVISRGHPWIFRTQLSSAASAFKAKEYLRLVDGNNQGVGYGIYDSNGPIGIRVLKRGETPPDSIWLKGKILGALNRRSALRNYTDSYRAINGESDGFPGIVFDVYGKTGVLQTYAPSVDALGRFVSGYLRTLLKLDSVIWKNPSRRKSVRESRTLFGKPPSLISVREGNISWKADLLEGQKTGSYLDLRGLRKWISLQKFHGKRVLNLFSNTGCLGYIAAQSGAKEVWNVDAAKAALDFGKKYHTPKGAKILWKKEDIFRWLPELSSKEKFDLIIFDPPNMAASTAQVKTAMKTYEQIYRALLPHLNKHGYLVGTCCTSRISRGLFLDFTQSILKPSMKLVANLDPEDDHPAKFREGDYLKILIYKS